MGGAYGLDFGAVSGFAASIGAMTPLLASLLPDIERVLVTALRSDDPADPETDE